MSFTEKGVVLVALGCIPRLAVRRFPPDALTSSCWTPLSPNWWVRACEDWNHPRVHLKNEPISPGHWPTPSLRTQPLYFSPYTSNARNPRYTSNSEPQWVWYKTISRFWNKSTNEQFCVSGGVAFFPNQCLVVFMELRKYPLFLDFWTKKEERLCWNKRFLIKSKWTFPRSVNLFLNLFTA